MFDHTTDNKSFVDVYRELKEMDIVNCEFMLELKNPDLQGLDFTNPTIAEAVLMLEEARTNPWFYIREMLQVQTTEGKQFFKLTVERALVLYCMFNGISVVYNTHVRQKGTSTLLLAVAAARGLTREDKPYFTVGRDKLSMSNLKERLSICSSKCTMLALTMDPYIVASVATVDELNIAAAYDRVLKLKSIESTIVMDMTFMRDFTLENFIDLQLVSVVTPEFGSIYHVDHAAPLMFDKEDTKCEKAINTWPILLNKHLDNFTPESLDLETVPATVSIGH